MFEEYKIAKGKIFDEYNPIKDKMFQIIDNDGKVINSKWQPKLDDKEIVKAYKDMLFSRTADLMTVSYQRQGRIYTFPPNYGQEAVGGATAFVMKEDDWLVPAFRENVTLLARGATLKEIFLYYMGNEDASRFENSKNVLPISVPIATQFPHAVGIGYAIKYNKEDKVVFSFVGDGGTSEGDFHEALNFAAVWNVPVIFIVQNNQYAISVPFKSQTASDGIAIKSIAYGMRGIQVDGNDYFAMYTALKEASDFARSGNGPSLIEAVTYRKGAHTTSDDPTKYRTKEEEKEWDAKDPLKRLKSYLIDKKVWSEEEEKKIVNQFKKEVDRQFEEAENYPPYKLEDVFDHLYSEKPDDLKKQQVAYEKYLHWKEARK